MLPQTQPLFNLFGANMGQSPFMYNPDMYSYDPDRVLNLLLGKNTGQLFNVTAPLDPVKNPELFQTIDFTQAPPEEGLAERINRDIKILRKQKEMGTSASIDEMDKVGSGTVLREPDMSNAIPNFRSRDEVIKGLMGQSSEADLPPNVNIPPHMAFTGYSTPDNQEARIGYTGPLPDEGYARDATYGRDATRSTSDLIGFNPQFQGQTLSEYLRYEDKK